MIALLTALLERARQFYEAMVWHWERQLDDEI